VKNIGVVIAFFFILTSQAQIDSLRYVKKTFAIQDTLQFNHVSSNPYFFKVINLKGQAIDSINYSVDFGKSKVYFTKQFLQNQKLTDSIHIVYYSYPHFLTQEYKGLDLSIIVEKSSKNQPISIENQQKPLRGKPLEGLDTQGNIIRGISIGNNQDAVLNSVLDLKIEGKLSSKVTLRARINDTNIPIQENGYSQDLKDLDRVYIEMEAPNWEIKAGDVFLKDSTSYFMKFNKKVAGVAVTSHYDKLHIGASGALVKGRYTKFNFQGKEANQGPYKLNGSNGETYIFIINKSEKVYINGQLQSRGRDKNYTIDYNTAEITFTATTPITSDMRIQIEFQYSDRNYSRFVTHESIQYHGEKWKMGFSYFNESDLKNQPLQISLTDEQKALLATMGNQEEQVFITQAIETEFDKKKLLYQKTNIDDKEIFVYSIDPEKTLYQVGFTYVGTQLGDYKVSAYLAIGKKMEYVGDNNGDYQAKVPLVAPSKKQIMAFHTSYKPNAKTDVLIELAYADNDTNLFSSIDDANNKAPALKATWNQVLIDSTKNGWQLSSDLHFDFIHKNFKSIESLYALEFDRDWNLDKTKGNQQLFDVKLLFSSKEKGNLFYNFENLGISSLYQGNKHTIGSNLQLKKLSINHLSSVLESKGNITSSSYVRTHTNLGYTEKKWWMNTIFDFEKNLQNTNNQLNNKSFRFVDAQALLGIGDSSKVFVEIGTQLHTNDSLVSTKLQRVNDAKSWYLNSQLIKEKNASLKVYANYRNVRYKTGKNTESLNSKLQYRQQLFNQFVVWSTDFKTSSGTIPKRDYTYVETEVGQGFYTWIDYNENGLQELDEFEVAQYADQANYLRISLPNIRYIATQEADLQQSIQVNFSKWNQKKGFKKFVSHWYNQFMILTKNNKLKQGDLVTLNPFDFDNINSINNQLVIRNSLVFNRGKAHYTTSYNYNKSRQKITQSFGNLENKLESHQIQFQHRIKENWQLGFSGTDITNQTDNETFVSRNYQIHELSFAPSIHYYFTKNNHIILEYSQTKKNNKIGDLETLNQQQIKFNYRLETQKNNHISIELKALKNVFTGSSFSAVGYQMLEGLQPDNNMIWSFLWSHKLNSFLYLNLNYNGRANAFSKTIHNGNVQLRANF